MRCWRFIIAATLLCAFATFDAGVAAAAEPSNDVDRVRFVRVVPIEQATGNAPRSVQFEVALQYRLATTSRAHLQVFLIEDDVRVVDGERAPLVWIGSGEGQVTLTFDYQPRSDVQTLTVVAGLFADETTLLAAARTNPLPVEHMRGGFGSPEAERTRLAFQQAMEAHGGGDYTRALDHLSTAISLSPEVGNLYYWRADTYARLKRYDDAIRDYTRTLALTPNDRASLVGRGAARLWKQDWEQAIADLSAVIEQTPSPDRWSTWALRGRAIALVALGRLTEAAADFRAYRDLAPDAPDRSEVESWIAALDADRATVEHSFAIGP